MEMKEFVNENRVLAPEWFRTAALPAALTLGVPLGQAGH
jgi:hypothetical protein